ncbi:MAG: Alanine racemase [Patescibacteria group bacterium]|nr:Alanine racemase [Patescibacteria group bacterium]
MLRRHEPLITVSISKENLLHNLRTYKEAYPEQMIAPVLKSNAYGHGLVVIAELLDKEDIAFFMVDSLYEAEVLRRAGIHSRIVVMGFVRPEAIVSSRLRNTDFAIVDIEQLRSVAKDAHAPVRLHLKFDTGMHRQGLLPNELTEATELIKQNPRLSVVGVGTHLADADNTDAMFTNRQLALWDSLLETVQDSFPSIECRHAAATKGVRTSSTHPMNVLRIGMGLYGCDTAPGDTLPLKPVLSMRSFVTSIRTVPEGDTVGYNATFRATRPSRIATVPAGYYEGIDRGLSNVGSLQVNGMACPIAGRVSMNMTSLDVTGVEVKRGDVVTLISTNPVDSNSVLSMARLAGTTPYVILAHIPTHLYRTVV